LCVNLERRRGALKIIAGERSNWVSPCFAAVLRSFRPNFDDGNILVPAVFRKFEWIMAWRVAKSLLTVRAQVDSMAPGPKRSSDGIIGDPAHQARNSHHNPNADGVVTAMDILSTIRRWA
jgi:hypothetical protein